MKGDFSRFTFDPAKRYSRVLQQQGRVQLDADWNEFVDIFVHRVRALSRDVFGPYGGPAQDCGFGISASRDHSGAARDLLISAGRYYVEGYLCRNHEVVRYTQQPDLRPQPLEEGIHLVYLDVWEQLVTCLEDETLLEVALGGPDTAVRTRLVWQVRVHALDRVIDPESLDVDWESWVQRWQPSNRGRLQVRTRPSPAAHCEPCCLTPGGGYQGLENRLYRFEIHRSGGAGPASFKWSRSNASTALAIESASPDDPREGTKTTLGLALYPAERDMAKPRGWVELLDSHVVLDGGPGSLARVSDPNRFPRELVVEWPCIPRLSFESEPRPVIRLWDQVERHDVEFEHGAVVITEACDECGWVDIEDGIQVRFAPGESYRSGDYWVVAARPATHDVEWPRSGEEPAARPPLGVFHAYAPLAVVQVEDGKTTVLHDCRWIVTADRRRVGAPKPCGCAWLWRWKRTAGRG